MTKLLSHLAGDCKFRDTRRGSADFCGAFFPDMSGARHRVGRQRQRVRESWEGGRRDCSWALFTLASKIPQRSARG